MDGNCSRAISIVDLNFSNRQIILDFSNKACGLPLAGQTTSAVWQDDNAY
jgi:hypothetical protein